MIVFPKEIPVATGSFGFVENDRVTVKGLFSGRGFSVGTPGKSLSFKLAVELARESQGSLVRALDSFLDSLVGASKYFYFSPVGVLVPSVIGVSNISITAVSVDGYTLSTSGWGSGVEGVIESGSWIGYKFSGGQARLFRVVGDVDSDSSGNADVVLSSPVLAGALSPIGEDLVFDDPQCVCEAVKPRAGLRPRYTNTLVRYSLDFKEVLNF